MKTLPFFWVCAQCKLYFITRSLRAGAVFSLNLGRFSYYQIREYKPISSFQLFRRASMINTPANLLGYNLQLLTVMF